jgi:glycosyltransferase involved in cell wall biosynthesis
MVGAYPDPYLDILRHELKRLSLRGVHLVDQVTDSYPYYRLADIFVCSSFEEAFPRVVMEAAAFGLPIVSTNVNGIPEMLRAGDAWLVPPGDSLKLADAMSAALDAHLSKDRSRAARAQRFVDENFSTTVLLPQHVGLALEAAGSRVG